MSISPARAASFEILQKIEKEKAYSSVLLPQYEENLSVKDRGLCHELTLGVLRRQMYLDKVIEKFVSKKLDTAVRIALRLGLYQLLFLDKVPAYSAINESVNLVQKAKKTSAKGLVNAVLRNATRQKIELEYTDEIDRVCVESSHPRWLIEKWTAQFGFDEAEKLAHVNNQPGRLEFRETARSGASLTGNEDAQTLTRLARAGEIYFQEEGSQMVAGAVKLAAAQNFLDVCAAPGSKITYIASRNAGENNFLVAGDLHFHRVEVLKQNCATQGVGFVNIVQYDAEAALPFADGAFDVALVDAPCSGTGTIRHNPEIRYFLEEKDLGELSNKQLCILTNASKLIKSGGKLIYSTCSLETEENEAVCAKFMDGRDDFSLISPDVSRKFITGRGFARTFPQRDDMDGFFIAVFEKN